MKYWICDSKWRRLTDKPLPSSRAAALVLAGYSSAMFLVLESEKVPGKIIEVFILR